MTEDFYCDEVLSGRTPVKIVRETDNVLAYHHTRPFWPVHIVVIPKRHISSLITLEESDDRLFSNYFVWCVKLRGSARRTRRVSCVDQSRKVSGLKTPALARQLR